MASDTLDWGEGSYEHFSPSLIAAAERLVAQAAPQPGDRAIDLGSGDGNVTLPLARGGAAVTAVEPAPRLLGVTMKRLADAGLKAVPIQAPAESLPLPDDSADLVVSNFAVIFSEHPEQAAREVLRVLAPGGRFLYTAWRPAGPLAEISAVFRRAAAPAASGATGAGDGGGSSRGVPEDSPSAGAAPRWDEPDFLAAIVPGGPGAITQSEGHVDFIASSPDAWADAMFAEQPAWRAAKAAVPPDRWPAAEAEIREILRAGSLERDRLVLRSPYTLVEVQPAA